MNTVKKVIVIEDDKDINELISYNLTKNGFEVVSFFDGSQTKEYISKEHFDVAIVDIMLPGADGFSVCKQIKAKADGYSTFVIMLTAKSASEDKIYAHLLGADHYLTKPFEVSELVAAVKELSVVRDRAYSVEKQGNGPSCKAKGGEGFDVDHVNDTKRFCGQPLA